MATATAPPRAGGRFPSGRVMPPDANQTHAYPARPSSATPPPPANQGAVPRKGGRTQQGSQQKPRQGGRTQQGTQGGATVAPQAQTPAAQPSQGQAGTTTTRRTLGGESYGAILMIFAYPLGFNLLRGGPSQMWGWLKAKFINQPYGAAAPATGGTAPATGLVQQGGYVGLAVPGQPTPPPVFSPIGRYPL